MDFSKLSKLEPNGARPHAELQGVVSVIVKVREPGYRPPRIQLRAELGPQMFTADVHAADLPVLQADPKVESVSVSRPIPLQKPGF